MWSATTSGMLKMKTCVFSQNQWNTVNKCLGFQVNLEIKQKQAPGNKETLFSLSAYSLYLEGGKSGSFRPRSQAIAQLGVPLNTSLPSLH